MQNIDWSSETALSSSQIELEQYIERRFAVVAMNDQTWTVVSWVIQRLRNGYFIGYRTEQAGSCLPK